MRHFQNLGEAQLQTLFSTPPAAFGRHDRAEVLATALGATLYMPAMRPTLCADLLRVARDGVVSAVVCLEDSIADHQLEEAERNVVAQLRLLGERTDGEDDGFPLTFVRVRHPDQISTIVDALGASAHVLSGFVLPKFSEPTGAEFLEATAQVRSATGLDLRVMPVIESPSAIHLESRAGMLAGVAQLLASYRDLVLAVRIGATDLSSAYGIRRDRELTVYDVRVVAEVIADVVNVLGRADGTGFAVTGPVWEYFPNRDRVLKPQLRQSPFAESDAIRLRYQLMAHDLDGLIREVLLDKANGLQGKTVIHPTHVPVVHALSVVTHEEYADASDILAEGMAQGGARASAYRNKMNEAKPHRSWAEKTLRRAAAFGVAAPEVGLVELLAAASPEEYPSR